MKTQCRQQLESVSGRSGRYFNFSGTKSRNQYSRECNHMCDKLKFATASTAKSLYTLKFQRFIDGRRTMNSHCSNHRNPEVVPMESENRINKFVPLKVSIIRVLSSWSDFYLSNISFISFERIERIPLNGTQSRLNGTGFQPDLDCLP